MVIHMVTVIHYIILSLSNIEHTASSSVLSNLVNGDAVQYIILSFSNIEHTAPSYVLSNPVT